MANINIRLNKNFTTQFNKMLSTYGEEFANLNGFGDSQLSYTDFIQNFIDSNNVADASVDGNANVGHKDIVSLINEMPKPHQKMLSFNKIYYEINKKYGFKTANDWLEAEWNKSLGMHDAHSASMLPYCFAYDLKDLAERGLYFIENFNAEPPKHLETFVDFVKEHCSYTCNRSAGAVAYPNLIPYLFYFWKQDVDNHYLGITEEYAETAAKQQIQRLIYALNQPFLRQGIQSAFTNVNFFDHYYFEAIFGGAEFPDGTYMIDFEEEIIEFQKMFLTEMSKIRHKNMMTYPVSTISLLTDKQGNFMDEEFAKWACEHNRKWNDSNWFVDSDVTSLSSCCRLKNNITDLGYSNSIGGAALKVGSVKVSTINLARLAYENPTEEQYLVALRDLVELNLKALDCQRHIIERNIEKGLLPNFTHKLIEMKYLYSTIGILGIYETMKTFGCVRTDEFGNTFYTQDAINFGKKIFKVIHNTKDNFMLDKDYKINLEAVPGESMAARFQKADELLYPEKVVKDLPLYGNQWIPLGIKTTLTERINIAAQFSEFCSGGDILHINVDAPFDSFEKAWDMLKYVSKCGVKYFAFTGKISACEHNHGFYGDVCPECGGPMVTQYSRIVGFYVPVKSYSKERKAEWKLRKWENVNANQKPN